MRFYRAASKQGMPRRRGAALILDIDETGVTAKFQSQTSKVARFCVRNGTDAKDAEDAYWDPMRECLRSVVSDFGTPQGPWDVDAGMDMNGEGGNCTSTAGIPETESGLNPVAVPAPDSPFPSVQFPAPLPPPGEASGLGALL